MFCQLFKLQTETGISILDEESCVSTCPFCLKDGSCKISKEMNLSLSKGKFGWRLTSKICFEKPQTTKNGNTSYTHIIKMIHPVHSNMWIVQALKKDKETIIFLVYEDGKHKDTYKSIDNLNKFLKEKYKYDGRDITEEDFQLCSE